MKSALIGAAFAASLILTGPATAQVVGQTQMTREAALKYCTEYTKKHGGKRSSDDQNQRTAMFKDCMVTQGQRP